MIIRWFDSLPSTSTALAADAAEQPHGTVYATRSQTAGRGQRGNSWEAAPGLNLTFSVLLRPSLPFEVSETFAVSMLTALAVADVLSQVTGEKILVKWPNDIYAGDRKLGGILIENSLQGHNVRHTIAGIGINVNQVTFESDAPNPVSLRNITQHKYDLEPLLTLLSSRVIAEVDSYLANPNFDSLVCRYRSCQWRGTGLHHWRDNRTGILFHAYIHSVSLHGTLTLTDSDGVARCFAFKEVSPVLPDIILRN